MSATLELTRDLMARRSVTPADEGCQEVMIRRLQTLGFEVEPLRFGAVENFWARHGSEDGPVFCFAGHTDVVPTGPLEEWRSDPFVPAVRDGVLYGRGAADMKSGLAAMITATEEFVGAYPSHRGRIAFLITSDEEGPSVDGTKRVMATLAARRERIDWCLVGEPSSEASIGDTIKIGRRGSLNTRVTVRGTQGHVAYPKRATNPLPAMAALVSLLSSEVLDQGNEHFDPSTLAFTTIDTGNTATNVIPAEAKAGFNIRFTDQHTPDSLKARIANAVDTIRREFGCEIETNFHVSGASFLTAPGPFTDLLSSAVQTVTGKVPQYSTTGGTSDARFIKDYCPVAELGLSNATMHKANECAKIEDIRLLADIYTQVLNAYFAAPPR